MKFLPLFACLFAAQSVLPRNLLKLILIIVSYCKNTEGKYICVCVCVCVCVYVCVCFNIPLLAHNTKRCLKRSGLIIKNLVGKGNRTLDHCYNDSMTIMLLAQTNYSDYLFSYTILKRHVALTAH